MLDFRAILGEDLVYDGADGWMWFQVFAGLLIMLPFGLLIFGAGSFGAVMLADCVGLHGPLRRLRARFAMRPATPGKRRPSWQLAVAAVLGIAFGALLVWYGVAPTLNRFLPTSTFDGTIDAMRATGQGRHRHQWIVVDGVDWTYPNSVQLVVREGDRVRVEVEYFPDGRLHRLWRRQ